MKKILLSAALVAPLLAVSGTAANAQMFDDLIVFGDSLSDPGNIPLVTGGLDIPPAPYFENQFSSGPNYTYLLDDLLGFQASRNLNFAVGGARTGPAVTQIGLGEDNGNALLNGTGTRAQVTNYLASSPTITERSLFILYAGGNDYLAFNPATDDVTTVVGNAVGNLAAQVQQLTGAGAKQIIVPLLPDLGITARSVAGGPAAQAGGTAISNGHNGALTEALQTLSGVTGAQLYVVDSATFVRDVVANPAKYGLTNVTEACFTGVSLCTDPESFLFFDGIHPSGKAQIATAGFMADTILGTRTPAAQGEVATRTAFDFNRALGQHARMWDTSDNKALFADIRYFDGDRDTETYTLGYDYSGYAASLGIAKDWGGFKIGVVGSYSMSEIDYQLGKGQTDVDSYRLGMFANFGSGRLNATVTGQYSWDEFDLSRITGVANQTADADTNGNVFSGTAEIRYALFGGEGSMFKVSPLVRLSIADGNIGAYTETGAVGLNRTVSSRDIRPGFAEFGAEITGDYDRLNWGLEGTWSTKMGDDQQRFSTALTSVSNVPVSILTDGTDYTFGRVTGHVGFDLSDALYAQINGTVTVSRDDSQDYGVGLTVGSKF